jgi:hypothetical protein
MQQKPVSPSDPTLPPSPEGPTTPKAARPTTIPELGVAGAVHDDPGLGPALMNAEPSAPGKPAGQPMTPEERAQEFAPVQGGTESASAGTLLVVAYLVMWALLIAFVLLSWRRQQRIDGRIAELEAALTKREK